MTRARDLAKGTFSGDLTVDTNTLVVDSANNRVGIGTTSPDVFSRGDSKTLGIQGATTASLGVNAASGSIASIYVGQNGVRAGQIVGASGSMTINAGSSNYLSLGTDFTERMRIDSAGRVTMPYQPSFVAGFTGGGYVTVPDANVIPFNYTGGSGAFDNGANFNTGTSRFTAPVTGRYFIQANCTAVSGGTRSIQIMKNGSAITNGADTIASFVNWTGASQTAVMSLIVYLAVGDYVDARTRNGSLDIYKNHTWFLGYLIG